MKQWITALGALAMMNGGCSAIVLDPVGSPPPEAAPKAIAMRAGDWMIPPDNPTDRLPVQLPYAPDPDALVLFLGDSGQQCGDPVLRGSSVDDLGACVPTTPFWQAIFVIPPELDRPGLIDLRDFRILTHESIWGPACGASASATASGNVPGLPESIEIVSSDATSVSVKLGAGPPVQGWTAQIAGDYTAARCGVAPPVSPPSPALAISGAHLSPPPGGAAPDPGALYLFFGTATETCDDPWSPVDCSHQRAVLSLPPSLQKPGIINLTDPAIAASIAYFQAPTSCDTGVPATGSFAGGTIEILSIDASGFSFKVYGSHTPLTLGAFDGDGLYAASICP